MKTELFVSAVVPLRHDADVLEAFIAELTTVLAERYTHYEVVLVDDGSVDELTPVLRSVLARYDCVRSLRLSRWFGEDVAIGAGLDVVIGDYAVVLRANEDPPHLLPELVEMARRGADVVYGVRLDRRDEPWWYRQGTRLFYWYTRRVLKLGLPADTTQFRCLSRRVLNAISQIRDQHRYLRLLVRGVGFHQQPFPYQPIARRGRATRRPSDSVNLALALITDNTIHPLRVVSWLGLIAAGANLVYGTYVMLIWAFKPDVAEGWVTLSLQNALQFFLVALILTVLCEYVGRIFNRLREGPSYIVLEEQNSTILLREDRRNVVAEPVTPVGAGSRHED